MTTTVIAPTTVTVAVSTRELKQAIATTSRAVSKKSLIPLLGGLCFTLEGTCLRVRGTNLELGISSSGVSLETSGDKEEDAPFIEEFVVSAAMLSDVLAPMNDDQVHLTFNPSDGTLLVATKQYKSTVRTVTDYHQKDFPPVDFPSSERTFIGTVASTELKRATSRVAYAASGDETRQALTGVLLEVKDGKATLVAADGYRLACHALPLVAVGEGDASLIIPSRTLEELARIADGNVEIYQVQEGNQVAFTFGTTLVLSRLIDGEFPDYTRVIPTEHFARAAVGPQDFLRAIKSVTPFAKEASNYMTITFREGELCLNANATEVGSGEAIVPAEVSGVAEEERRIALNSLFVKDALERLKNEAEVWIEMQEPSTPLVITIPSPDGGASEYTYVIMPMTQR